MSLFNLSRTVLACLALLLLIPILGVRAQTTSGQISGQVLDPAGAAVVGATVTLRNQLTGETRVATTLNSGDFVFVGVLPGVYSVAVEAPGFKRFEKRDLKLSASERLAAGSIKLEMGAVSQRSEEHTSELQSQFHLVCRLLLEKK